MTPVLWVCAMLGATAVIYSATAAAYQFVGRPGMMLAFIGYVIANVGLIWDAIRGQAP